MPRSILMIRFLVCLWGAAALTYAGDPVPKLVSSYLEGAGKRQQAVRGVQMEAQIDATLPKLAKAGHLRLLRSIAKSGQITYKILASSGDRTVRQEVITRYLTADAETSATSAFAITLANYTFRLKGASGAGVRKVYVFQLTPRKKKPGLFKGELWLDGDTGMPVRESGQFVKNPSVFIRTIRFVREYEIQDGVAIPFRMKSTIETRIAGRAELSVEFSNFTRKEISQESCLYKGVL
jgi:hypothetical protein